MNVSFYLCFCLHCYLSVYLSTSPWQSAGQLWLGRAEWSGATSEPIIQRDWSWPSSDSFPVQTARPACTTDRERRGTVVLWTHSLLLRVNEALLAAPYHSDSLQVNLSTAEFLPTVMFVTLPLRHTTELTSRLEHVFYQGTTTYLICWDLTGGRRRDKLAGHSVYCCDELYLNNNQMIVPPLQIKLETFTNSHLFVIEIAI